MKKLYRSRKNQTIGGVCSGLAEYFGWDVTIVRLIAFLAIMFGGVSFWFYVIAWIVIPEEPRYKYEPIQTVEDTPQEQDRQSTNQDQVSTSQVKSTPTKDNGPEW